MERQLPRSIAVPCARSSRTASRAESFRHSTSGGWPDGGHPLDRASVRACTVARFGVEKMIDAYEETDARLAPQRIDAAPRRAPRCRGASVESARPTYFSDDDLRALLPNDLRIDVVLP